MPDDAMTLPSNLAARIGRWSLRIGLGRKLALALTIAALASGIATFTTLSSASPFAPNPKTVLILLNLDLVLLLALGGLVGRRLVQVWIQRRHGSAGSRLHIRLVVLFALVAATPTIIVATFSAVFFSLGLQSWFSERVSTALHKSQAVAEAYLNEHQGAIRGDILAMASDLNRASRSFLDSPERFARIVATQGMLRSLTEARVFDGSGRVLVRWNVSYVLASGEIPSWAVERAGTSEPILLTNPGDDRLRAIIKLDRLIDTYLYVSRFVEPQVLQHIEETRRAVSQYQKLEGQRSSIQVTFAMMFVLVALLLLFVAIWVGLSFATQLVKPIGGLIAAAERVGAGDLSARVQGIPSDDEIGSLSRAFNRMTDQLETQRGELVEANRQADARRHFMETVLAGVSAGVIGLDPSGQINLPNRSASELLSVDLDRFVGRPLGEAIPEFSPLLARALERPERLAESEIKLVRDRSTRTLLVRIAADRETPEMSGFVVTFDDVTELMAAQRNAAWADVARRIAHEIKNPLTPIQLAAERLQRKYLSEIKGDPDTFSNCTETIIRQVGDIGRMVDEFSSFARMPSPVLKLEDLRQICRQSIFLQQTAHPDIEFERRFPDDEPEVLCDEQLIGQALINLLQNAVDSIRGRAAQAENALPKGKITVEICEDNSGVLVEVSDNGKGLPEEGRDSLAEPYVTTREKGTGLGLAIVKKIMEDHGGGLVLADRDGGGARVTLVFHAAGSDRTREPDAKSEVGLSRKAAHGV